MPRLSDPQSLNRYAYSRNNPLGRIDPSGNADTCNPALFSCGFWGSRPATPAPLFPNPLRRSPQPVVIGPPSPPPPPPSPFEPPPPFNQQPIGPPVPAPAQPQPPADNILEQAGIGTKGYSVEVPTIGTSNIQVEVRGAVGGRDRVVTISPDQVESGPITVGTEGNIELKYPPIGGNINVGPFSMGIRPVVGAQVSSAGVHLLWGFEQSVELTTNEVSGQVEISFLSREDIRYPTTQDLAAGAIGIAVAIAIPVAGPIVIGLGGAIARSLSLNPQFLQ